MTRKEWKRCSAFPQSLFKRNNDWPTTPSRSPTSEWSAPSPVTSEKRADRKRSINLACFHLSGHSPHLGHIWHYVRSPWALMESLQGRNCKVEILFKSLDITEINFIFLTEAAQIAQRAVQMWWEVAWGGRLQTREIIHSSQHRVFLSRDNNVSAK